MSYIYRSLVLSILLSAGTLAQSFDEFDKYLAGLPADKFAGSIVVARDGQTVYQKGVGQADRDAKTANDPKMVYEIGSTSKQFTAFAVVDLALASRVAFSDTLTKYFDNVPDDKKAITIHQLLTHSSGLAIYHDKYGPLESLDKTEALKRIFSQKLKFKPGDKYDYSNSGYTLLAMIVEKVTGEEFKAYMKRLIYERARVRVQFYGERDWPRESVATGYSFGGKKHSFDQYAVSWAGLGAGYMMTSPSEYMKWMTYLTSTDVVAKYGKYLFGEYVPYPLNGEKAFYGYGWVTLYRGDNKIIYHNGGDTSIGCITTVRWYPAKKSILVISANNYSYESHAIFDVKNAIEKVVLAP